nr:MAG TPA: tail assembly chaperone protein [Caudoviricetes sp.]
MKTGEITLNGKRFFLCFSVRVMRACTERYGNLEKISQALTAGTEAQRLDESIWLLCQMLDGGNRYAKLEGLENPEPYGLEDLYDVIGVDDLAQLNTQMMAAIQLGVSREVETQEEKKGKKTKEAAQG